MYLLVCFQLLLITIQLITITSTVSIVTLWLVLLKWRVVSLLRQLVSIVLFYAQCRYKKTVLSTHNSFAYQYFMMRNQQKKHVCGKSSQHIAIANFCITLFNSFGLYTFNAVWRISVNLNFALIRGIIIAIVLHLYIDCTSLSTWIISINFTTTMINSTLANSINSN